MNKTIYLDREAAEEIYLHARAAATDLMRALRAAGDKCPLEDYEAVRRGVGLSLGAIQIDVIDIVNYIYPEMDDLKNVTYEPRPAPGDEAH